MNVKELKQMLESVEDDKEVVVIAQEGKGTYELWTISDCMNDPVVLFHCRPPSNEQSSAA